MKTDFTDPVQILVHSLQSDKCPACDGFKKPKQTFCLKDFRSLTRPLRTALYCYVGEGYEEAVQTAMQALGCRFFYIPGRAFDLTEVFPKETP